nr:MAG TPA: hypothetical protein [Caudoviricetes sp.]
MVTNRSNDSFQLETNPEAYPGVEIGWFLRSIFGP